MQGVAGVQKRLLSGTALAGVPGNLAFSKERHWFKAADVLEQPNDGIAGWVPALARLNRVHW